MIYNTKLKRVRTMLDCAKCAHFDQITKTCKGLNKICFEYDEKTQTIIDGITKMPRKV